MSDMAPKKSKQEEFFSLERDPARLELSRRQSILRTTEWGLLTLGSLLAAAAFPPYFIQVLWLAFFNANGLLWVTHLNELGRKRLLDFEREFSKGHTFEEKGHYADAVKIYEDLPKQFVDYPKFSEICASRVAYLRREHPQAFGLKAAKARPTRKARPK